MKTKNLLFLLLFLLPCTIYSQSTIIAPSEVCQGECHDIIFIGESSAQLSWVVSYNGSIQTFQDSTLYLCFDEPGVVNIELVVENNNGNTEVYVHDIFVGNGGAFTINSDPSCQALSPDSCEQVCAFSTVTYSINNQTNQPVVWTVNGAVDFVVDQNTVTVDWGEPGQGSVSVRTLDSLTTEESDPLRLLSARQMVRANF